MSESIREMMSAEITRIRSRRGRELLIRPPQPGDRAALQRMLAALSPRTVGMRYFIPDVPLSAVRVRQEAERLLSGDQIVYLAVSGGSDPQIVAIAELVRDRRAPHVAESAIVVADSYQGEGIGTAIVGCLAHAVAQTEIAIIRAITQAHNQVVQRMISRLGRPYTTTCWRGEVTYEIGVA